MITSTLGHLLSASEGRYLTMQEQEQLLVASLEMPLRIEVSQLLHQREQSIIEYATDAFCNTIADFEGPSGSLRRKKGHQDGRILLRFIAQGIRDGGPHTLYEKVLSWLIGHLDEHNVTGKHMEIFLHFILQGCRRELPSHMHGIVTEAFEDVIQFIQRSTHSGTIHRAFRRIAESAVSRLLEISEDAKTRYGGTTQAKCRRDFELFIKELARCLKSDSARQTQERVAGWLIDRLVNQVAYPERVWYWSFLSINEAIVDCCGPEVAASTDHCLQSLADHASELTVAVSINEAASKIADATADRLIENGMPLGLFRSDEFKTAMRMANRQLLEQLAVQIACGLEDASESLSQLWLRDVLPLLPQTDSNLLANNLKLLIETSGDLLEETPASTLKDAILRLVEVARRVEAAERISALSTPIVEHCCEALISEQLIAGAQIVTWHRHLRNLMGRLNCLLAAGQPGDNAYQLRRFLVLNMIPSQDAPISIVQRALAQLQTSAQELLESEDARFVDQYLGSLTSTAARYEQMHRKLENLDKFTSHPVQRGYQAHPRHETLQRHGAEAGRRDAYFLLEKVVHAAIVGGEQAQQELHQYLIQENIRLSGLPGSIVVEFIRGIQEQLLDAPEIVALLVDLAQCAPLYTAAMKMRLHSDQVAQDVSERHLASDPDYARSLSETGPEACHRDYAIMIRGISASMLAAPRNVEHFKNWWNRRIGENLHNKPAGYDSTNKFAAVDRKGLVNQLNGILDQVELGAVESFLDGVIDTDAFQKANKRSNSESTNQASGSGSLTLADVIG